MEIDDIKLERPLFYKNTLALRFEIGSPDIRIWTDPQRKCYNETYFSNALARALTIFESAFSPDDDMSVVYQIFSDGRRKIKKQSFIYQQIKKKPNKTIKLTDHRELYADQLSYKQECWRRSTISGLKTADLKVENLLSAILNTDFGKDRNPRLRGECYFVNHSKNLVLFMYDDRGMDIVAAERSALVPIYNEHQQWILDYDRPQIERIFAEASGQDNIRHT